MNAIRFNLPLVIGVVFFGSGCGNDPSSSVVPDNGKSKTSSPQKSQVANRHPPFQLREIDPQESGVSFRHVSGNATDKPFPAANGSGVGAIDYDLDGNFDLCFATGTPFPIRPTPGSPSSRLYRNLGDWRFEDVSSLAGISHLGFSAGIAVGDIDNDGFPDVYLTCFGQNALYRNLGDGTFAVESTLPADGGNFSTSAAFLDYDADGFLDLYVCNYGKWSYESNAYCGDRERNIRIFCSPKSLKPERDVLMRNLGDGRFHDASAKAGLDKSNGRGQGVLATDVNGDGHIDLYLGNDIHPNFLYLNSEDHTFRDATEISGTAYDREGRMQAGMGVAGADANRDGLWDLFVTNFEKEHHTLYQQSAGLFFNDVSSTTGLSAASLAWVGWGAAFVDFDLDGWKDLIVTNGHVDDNLIELGRETPYEHPGLVWQNSQGRFRFLGESTGSYFRRNHPGRGLATVDLDNDGDTDIVLTHQDQPPALLRNDNGSSAASPRRSVVIRLIGTRSNRDAVGSRIQIRSDVRSRIEQIQGGGSYLSAHDLRMCLAVEPGDKSIDIEIRWASGDKSSIKGMIPGRQYDIVEPWSRTAETRVNSRPLHNTQPE